MRSRFRCLAVSLTALLPALRATAGPDPVAPPTELVVPAFTAYLDPDVETVGVTASSGITRWTDPGVHVMWFGEIRTPGDLACAVRLRLAKGVASKLRLTVGSKSKSVTVVGTAAGKATGNFGEFPVPTAGFVRFQLESLNPTGRPAGDVESLVLRGPPARDARFNLKSRRTAASVHLNYRVPPALRVSTFTCEVTATEDPVASFYMACGWHRGYLGMQVNRPQERRILFSVWDSGSEAKDRSLVRADDRVTLVEKGDGVHVGEFGNEGTGGQSYLVYPWKTGETQRFAVVASRDGPAHGTFSGYYFLPDAKRWLKIATWRAPNEDGTIKGLSSFNEDFADRNGHLRRRALFGPQWIRSDAGAWTELTSATFTHDPTGDADRFDRFGGIESGRFFLSNGGFVPGTTPGGTEFVRPKTDSEPAFDPR